MEKFLSKSLSIGIFAFIINVSSYANIDLSQLKSSDNQAKILAAKELSHNLRFLTPGFSFVSEEDLNNSYSISTRDPSQYQLIGLWNNLARIYTYDSPFYELILAVPNNETLEEGLYTNVLKYPWNNDHYRPGLDFNINDDPVCISISGKFKILEIEKDDEGGFTKIAADFEKRCGMNRVATLGAVRFNSSLPTTSAPAILYEDILIIPILKRADRNSGKVIYNSMTLHRMDENFYEVDSIIPAENSGDDEILIPGGYDAVLDRFVLPSVIEMVDSNTYTENEMRFEKLPNDLRVGMKIKLIENIRVR